jgi:hypothetical protein
MAMMRAQILVVGGGLGGVAAALAAAESGDDVVLTASTDWLGGVLTSQAVPPDEHVWIEQFGCTRTYRRLRDEIRAFYRRWYPLGDRARREPYLNPGGGHVSALCCEPRVVVAVIDALLAPHRSARRLRVLSPVTPLAADVDGGRVTAVALRDLHSGDDITIEADWIIDATETGDLLPLAGVEHVTGAEARDDTGEPHGAAEHQPLNMQPVSVCFAVDHIAGGDFRIDRPEGYDRFRDERRAGWPEGQLSLLAPDPRTNAPVARTFLPNPPAGADRTDEIHHNVDLDKDLWLFRRIADRHRFVPGTYSSDITLVNWPQIDYWGGPIFGLPDDEVRTHLRRARQLSLSWLYWLQHEAPRPDGGHGWPGLRLRGDVVGDTPDGLAPEPYIREARRIRAEYTVVEQDIALEVRGAHGARPYEDAVGIGSYRIDLHPSTGGDPYIDIGCCPFQIPLGSLLPVRIDNLLPGARNIGTTHITNGAYRLPPIEWNVGEVAGHLALFCAANGLVPRQVRATPDLLARFQARLTAAGVELAWPVVAGY